MVLRSILAALSHIKQNTRNAVSEKLLEEIMGSLRHSTTRPTVQRAKWYCCID